MSQQPIIAPAKPIVVIRVYYDTLLRQYDKIVEPLEKKFSDYHVLVIGDSENNLTIETYYEKDMESITIKELENLVKSSINELKSKNDTRTSTK